MVRQRVVRSRAITNRVAFEISKSRHQVLIHTAGRVQVKAKFLALINEGTIGISRIGLTVYRTPERECRNVTPGAANLRKQILAARRLYSLGPRQISPSRDRQCCLKDDQGGDIANRQLVDDIVLVRIRRTQPKGLNRFFWLHAEVTVERLVRE